MPDLTAMLCRPVQTIPVMNIGDVDLLGECTITVEMPMEDTTSGSADNLDHVAWYAVLIEIDDPVPRFSTVGFPMTFLVRFTFRVADLVFYPVFVLHHITVECPARVYHDGFHFFIRLSLYQTIIKDTV